MSTYRSRNADDEAERAFPKKLTVAVVCSVVAIPLMAGMGISWLDVSFPITVAMGIPAIIIAVAWFLMVERVRQRGGYARVVVSTGELLPRGFLSPFVYSFMWCQWVVWTGIASWAIYAGDVRW